jgi:hypothetical protein
MLALQQKISTSAFIRFFEVAPDNAVLLFKSTRATAEVIYSLIHYVEGAPQYPSALD